MRWSCKSCNFRTSTRLELLKHYRLKHLHTRSLPCLYSDCLCSFKGWGALKTHLSRDHPEPEQLGQIVSFSCLVCNLCGFHTEKQYFEHLRTHLKKHKTIQCVFKRCDYSIFIYLQLLPHIKVGSMLLTAWRILSKLYSRRFQVRQQMMIVHW